MNDDFLDPLSELSAANARFLIVGAYAVGIHGRPRATEDLDIWVDPAPANAHKVMEALVRFGLRVLEELVRVRMTGQVRSAHGTRNGDSGTRFSAPRP